ncbi:Plasmodium exported protein, unknown function [Plasmodium vivax]|nr:Plasmodium exported protein, unknown function [Plasmodium vivax]SCO67901.1 Plasmodium exported protein, unknown function [Plasmodium vivax]VUZ96647.1 Plasmodium exported protein, unknown function [Plasmodium vivax]
MIVSKKSFPGGKVNSPFPVKVLTLTLLIWICHYCNNYSFNDSLSEVNRQNRATNFRRTNKILATCKKCGNARKAKNKNNLTDKAKCMEEISLLLKKLAECRLNYREPLLEIKGTLSGCKDNSGPKVVVARKKLLDIKKSIAKDLGIKDLMSKEAKTKEIDIIELIKRIPTYKENCQAQIRGAKQKIMDCRDSCEAQIRGAKQRITDYKDCCEAHISDARRKMTDYRDDCEAQFLDAKKKITDYRDDCEAQFLDAKKKITGYRDDCEAQIRGAKQKITDYKDCCEAQIRGAKQKVTDYKDSCEAQILGAKKKVTDYRDSCEAQILGAKKKVTDYKKNCEAHITGFKDKMSDIKKSFYNN